MSSVSARSAAAMGRKVLAVDAAASHLRLVQHSKALNRLDNLICCQSVGDLRRLIEALGYRVFCIEGDRWVYAPPDQLRPECWVDMLALGRRDQRGWTARIDQKWEPRDILRKCREWAGPDHAESAGELLLALRQQTFQAPIAGAVMELTDHLEQMIADSSLTCQCTKH